MTDPKSIDKNSKLGRYITWRNVMLDPNQRWEACENLGNGRPMNVGDHAVFGASLVIERWCNKLTGETVLSELLYSDEDPCIGGILTSGTLLSWNTYVGGVPDADTWKCDQCLETFLDIDPTVTDEDGHALCEGCFRDAETTRMAQQMGGLLGQPMVPSEGSRRMIEIGRAVLKVIATPGTVDLALKHSKASEVIEYIEDLREKALASDGMVAVPAGRCPRCNGATNHENSAMCTPPDGNRAMGWCVLHEVQTRAVKPAPERVVDMTLIQALKRARYIPKWMPTDDGPIAACCGWPGAGIEPGGHRPGCPTMVWDALDMMAAHIAGIR